VSASGERPSCVVVSHAYLEPEVSKALHALAAHLDVRLVTPLRSPVLVFEDRRSESLADSSFDVSGFHRFPRGGVLFLFASIRLGLERRPDHVLVEYDPWAPVFWQVVLARWLCARRARLYVVVKKNTFRHRPRGTALIKTWLARAGLRRVDGVLAASRKAAQLYRDEFGVADRDIHVVPMHPVDTDHFRPRPVAPRADRVAIGFAGRLDTRKGADVLLDALDQLITAGEPVVLHAVGPMGDVSIRADRASANGSLVWHPPVANSEIASILQDIDIFVMPSSRLPDHEEHDGRALLEAMATRIACIGSDSGIIPELLGAGRGRLFPAGDATALVREIRRLISDPDQCERLGRKGREYVVQFASTEAAALARVSVLTQTDDREMVR
jgi:glycosyltransferase involved in cell wall biosynthesis